VSAFAICPADAGSQSIVDAIRDEGFCVVQNAIGAPVVDAINQDLDERFERTPFGQGDFYGYRTKRFGALLKRSPYASAFVANPVILEVARALLERHCDRIQLNLAQGLEIHPGEIAQAPHRDGDIWHAESPHLEFSVNVMWPLEPYTRDNGATRVWPKSNQRPLAPLVDFEAGVAIEMAPGSALLFLGSTVHAAGANRSDGPRRGLLTSYCLGWLKPYENQWLAYPPEVARAFDPELQRLVGYQLHRPNLGNYEGQCPSVVLSPQAEDYLPAVEEMRPDQSQALRAFAEIQHSCP
jgi:ectoine hydroxylase-related dioxygenase (phytanoyl-CoA dioxygenase family)